MGGPEELYAYKFAFELALQIHEVSKGFPFEERFALTDQVRRSSRSVCANLFEAYRKRRYIRHFISKLSDANGENAETGVWLSFAFRLGYISHDQFSVMSERNDQVGRLISYMTAHPDKFIGESAKAI